MWLQIRNGSGLNVKRKKEEKRSLRLQMCCDMNPSPFPWKERKRRKEVYVCRSVVNPSPFPWKEQEKRKEVYVCWGVVNPSPLCWDLASTITARQPIYTGHTILIIEQPHPFPQPILWSFALFSLVSQTEAAISSTKNDKAKITGKCNVMQIFAVRLGQFLQIVEKY